MENPVIVIVGPTASGKSDLAQAVALAVEGEIISADSMQVYRGMDIGTGKVPASERRVPHHGLDLVNPGQPYSAALFQNYARALFPEIERRGKRSILCGGTGFYVRAALDAYDFPAGEQVDNKTRDVYNALAREQGAQAVWDVLHEKDPESAAIISVNDVKRVVRALELLEEGITYHEQRAQLAHIPQVIPAVFLGVRIEPMVLRERIEQRVDMMFAQGLVDEVKQLLQAGFRDAVTSNQAIGYKEVVSALDGHISMEEAVQQIKTATKRYAKRQRTWFNKDKRITWIEATHLDAEQRTKAALDVLRQKQYG